MCSVADTVENERIEIKLLLQGLYLKYVYDFRDYAGAHLKRRLPYCCRVSSFTSYSEMLHRLIYEEELFYELLLDLAINVTEMFRDPWVYQKNQGTGGGKACRG